MVHAGEALSTFYQCGEGYRLDPETLEQRGAEGWVPLDGISAHPKVDEHTGELMFFNYSKHAPYLHYGVVDRDNRLTNYIPIPLAGPRLPHDMAFTEHYSILNDLPVFWDAELLKKNVHAVRKHDGLPSRFAIVPRHGGSADVRWFEAEPTYVLHWVNAYEDGDEVILDGYFQEEPTPGPHSDAPPGFEHMMAFLDDYSFRPKLHRWRFDLRTGKTREERLDDRVLEFGMINGRHGGAQISLCLYHAGRARLVPVQRFRQDRSETGKTSEYVLAPNRFASEAPFAPRIGATEEDDGYLVSFVTDENTGTSECILLDARHIEDGPVCRIALPHKLCSGTHACWAPRKQLQA